MSLDTMAAKIAAQETALIAAGSGSWKWQLRDQNGQWIKMGSKVKWVDKGKSRSGKIVGSPKAGTAVVEDDEGNRHTLTTNRLTATEAPSAAEKKATKQGKGKFTLSAKANAAAKSIADDIVADVDKKDRKKAVEAVGEYTAGQIAGKLPEKVRNLPAVQAIRTKGAAALKRLRTFFHTNEKFEKVKDKAEIWADEFVTETLHAEGSRPGLWTAFHTLHIPSPFKEPVEFLSYAQEHLTEAILEHGHEAIEVMGHAINLMSSGEKDRAMLDPGTMEARIAAREAAMTAAGTGNWKWQLRDRNGQWIDMGALVKWMANGQAREGKITGSPQEGMAEVEESKTKRRLRIASNRLTVLAGKVGEKVDARTGGRDDKGTLDVGAVVNRKKGGSSQPEPDTVPETKASMKGADPETAMPQDQIDRLSKGVNWKAPSSTDGVQDTFFKKVFNAIKNLREPDGAVRPGRVDGTGTEDDPIYVGSDIKLAHEHLLAGKHIRMHSRQDIVSVLTKEFAALMKERGIETVNMCQVSVKDTNLFCQEDKDIIRDWMPQLSGKDSKGQKKDVQPWTEQMYEELNMIDPVEPVDPNLLKASQSELKTEQIIGMTDGAENYINMTIAADRLRKDGKTDEADALIAERDKRAEDDNDFTVMSLDVLTEAILVTDDGYIIDGHHRWAALMLLNERLASRGLPPLQMQVRRVKQEIGEALVTVNAIAKAADIQKKSGGSAGAEPDILRDSKVNPQVAARLKEWSAAVDKELGPDASKWKEITKAKKISVRTQAKTKAALKAKEVEARAKHALAGSIEVGDILLQPDDTFRVVQRVLVETSGGRTFLQQEPYTGELSLAILASAAPLVVVLA